MPARLRHLDVARGLAILGILNRNAISFALPGPAYVQFDLAGSSTALDRVVGTIGNVVADEWPLGLVAMLFGVGVALFVGSPRSAPAPRLRAVWRGALLFAMGLAHLTIWEGDILTVYGAIMPVLVLATFVAPRWVLTAGVTVLAGSVIFGLGIQGQVNAVLPPGLPWFLLSPGEAAARAIRLGFLLDMRGRALGMGLVGVGIAGTPFIRGSLEVGVYRRIAWAGIAGGAVLSAAGQVLQLTAREPARIVFVAEWICNAGSAPMALGIISAAVLWCRRVDASRWSLLRDRIDAVGRTALSTYLLQTAIGITLFRSVVEFGTVGRATLVGFCVAMWGLSLVISPWWLARFRQGPLEWAWRVATYLRLEPFRADRTVIPRT